MFGCSSFVLVGVRAFAVSGLENSYLRFLRSAGFRGFRFQSLAELGL